MYLNKDAILDSLSLEDVKKVVISLGSAEPKKDSEGNLIFQTICHGGKNYKLYYYHEANEVKNYKAKTFHCYTDCGESFGIVELVIRAKRSQGKTVTWYTALKYIGQITNKLISLSNEEIEEKNNRISDFEWINRVRAAQKNKKAIPTLSEINENILEIFDYRPHEVWLNDNINREALSRFEIGYWGEHDAITIPHRDINGRLIGLRLRYLDPLDIANIGKYVPAMIQGKFLNHQLGSNLYGLHIVKDTIIRKKKVMLVEAEKSALQTYTYFGDESFTVATCGSAITLTQQKIILNQLKVEEVIYAPDRDYHESDSYSAEIWWKKQIKKVAALVPYVRVYIIADNKERLSFKDSPTDNGKEILLALMKEKILITMDEVNRVLNEKEVDDV